MGGNYTVIAGGVEIDGSTITKNDAGEIQVNSTVKPLGVVQYEDATLVAPGFQGVHHEWDMDFPDDLTGNIIKLQFQLKNSGGALGSVSVRVNDVEQVLLAQTGTSYIEVEADITVNNGDNVKVVAVADFPQTKDYKIFYSKAIPVNSTITTVV